MLYPEKVNMTQLHNPLKLQALRYTEFRTVFSATTGKPLQRQRSVLKGGGAHLPLSHTRTPSQIFQNTVYVVC